MKNLSDIISTRLVRSVVRIGNVGEASVTPVAKTWNKTMSDPWEVAERLRMERVVEQDGTIVWLLDGKTHRRDGPAIERPDGGRHWCLHGKLHRVNGPAVSLPDGRKEWWVSGTMIRKESPQ